MLLTLNRLTRSAFPENWRELDRMFEELFGTRFAGTTHAGALFPSLNLLEDEQNLYVEATVPGLALEDIEAHPIQHGTAGVYLLDVDDLDDGFGHSKSK